MSFPALKRVGASLEIADNSDLTEIGDFPSLEEIGESLRIGYNPELKKIGSFPKLKSAGGITFSSADKLETIGSFDELTEVAGPLGWSYLDSLTDMGSFPKLERVASFDFYSNSAMTALANFPMLKEISGRSNFHEIIIEENEGLTSIDGLKNLETVNGGVAVKNNPNLPQADVEDLFADVDIDGAEDLCGNKGGPSC